MSGWKNIWRDGWIGEWVDGWMEGQNLGSDKLGTAQNP